jgi:drug/metabolite transporter (DMT)-like permease
MLAALIPALFFWRREVIRSVAGAGWLLVVSGLLLAITFNMFIVALSLTTVANTLVMIAMAPFATAIVLRLTLGERVPGWTWLAMSVAVGGIVLTVLDSFDGDRLLGALVAAIVPIAFSFNTAIVRRHRELSMLPAVALAALFSALMALPFADPGALAWRQVPWLAVLGPIQLGLGLALFLWGVRFVPGAQAALFGLLEIVLGPFWVWLIYGERLGTLGLIGSAVVLGAILLNGAMEMARERRAGPVPA